MYESVLCELQECQLQGCNDISMVKSTGFFSRRAKFDSQYPHGDLPPFVTQEIWDPSLSSAGARHHDAQVYMKTENYTNKNKHFFKWCQSVSALSFCLWSSFLFRFIMTSKIMLGFSPDIQSLQLQKGVNTLFLRNTCWFAWREKGRGFLQDFVTKQRP